MIGAACSISLLGTQVRAAEGTDSGLAVVAPDSQSALEAVPETPERPNDERWRQKPFHVGLSTILGFPQEADPFLMAGAEFAYALPHVSLAATFGYLDGINASLAARGRLHLGHAVALTLGPSVALLPLHDACALSFGEVCKQQRHWGHALFGGGEIGVEGRTEAGFVWRAQAGFWGLLAHGDGTCKAAAPSLSCSARNLQPGVVQTEEVTVGWAF